MTTSAICLCLPWWSVGLVWPTLAQLFSWGRWHTWALRDPEQQQQQQLSPSEIVPPHTSLLRSFFFFFFFFGYHSPQANAANFCSSIPYAAEFSHCICSLWVICWMCVSGFTLTAFSHPEPPLAGRQFLSVPSKSVTYERYSVISYACFWKATCYKLRVFWEVWDWVFVSLDLDSQGFGSVGLFKSRN